MKLTIEFKAELEYLYSKHGDFELDIEDSDHMDLIKLTVDCMDDQDKIDAFVNLDSGAMSDLLTGVNRWNDTRQVLEGYTKLLMDIYAYDTWAMNNH